MSLILIDGGGGRRHLGIAELRSHLSSGLKSQFLQWFQAGSKKLVKNTMAQVLLLGDPAVGSQELGVFKAP